MPAKLLLIGDGPDRQRIETACRQSEFCGDVQFLGKLTVPEDVLVACDLFLLTSETESFGLAALEAMACGVPVVSSNTGGTPEVNRDGVSGLLSPVGDVDAMSSNALKILGDDATLARYREGALTEAKRFDVNKVLPMYEALYKQVIEAGT